MGVSGVCGCRCVRTIFSDGMSGAGDGRGGVATRASYYLPLPLVFMCCFCVLMYAEIESLLHERMWWP